MKAKTGVLLINLGTPDSPSVGDVRKYLREFLSDPRVIDINSIGRFLLVNLIIAPFRGPKSAKIYKKVWTDKGSPLLVYGKDVRNMLQKTLGEDYLVCLGMRYQSPSIDSALEELKKNNVEEIIVFPMFPQYASATTGSVHEKVMSICSKWQSIPKMVFIDSYAGNQDMIDVFAKLGKQYLDKEAFDHVLFSYHGLPERQIKKAEGSNKCLTSHCCSSLHQGNRLCYKAQCYETSRQLAKELGLAEHQYDVCFQSRLGKSPWIRPYTDETIKKVVAAGKKRVLAFSPSFVADCLETTIEIGEEYKEVFEHAGGERWQMVESLNNDPQWVEAIAKMIKEA